jgi:hypothetical protein
MGYLILFWSGCSFSSLNSIPFDFPFTCWWIFEILEVLTSDQSCCEHFETSLLMDSKGFFRTRYFKALCFHLKNLEPPGQILVSAGQLKCVNDSIYLTLCLSLCLCLSLPLSVCFSAFLWIIWPWLLEVRNNELTISKVVYENQSQDCWTEKVDSGLPC